MDKRLQDIATLITGVDSENAEMELSFAIAALTENDPASLRWLAACCAVRAAELD